MKTKLRFVVLMSLVIAILIPTLANAQPRSAPQAILEVRVKVLERALATLQDQVNSLISLLNQEINNRTNADNGLQGQITSLQTNLAKEIIDKSSAVADLQTQINNNKVPENLKTFSNYLKVNPNVINGLKGPHVIFEGVNVHVRSGSGQTWDKDPDYLTNNPELVVGLGNLIIGYNEVISGAPARTGSHNIVVGINHSYSSFGGFVAGLNNEICGLYSSVSGGWNNTASGNESSISGGSGNTAYGHLSSVSGGWNNTASGNESSISGGGGNTASSYLSSVSGGVNRTAQGAYNWVAGTLLEEQ